jgi:hypothetical protein
MMKLKFIPNRWVKLYNRNKNNHRMTKLGYIINNPHLIPRLKK